MISIEIYNKQFDIIIFTEGLTSFFWQICALLWPADYGELVSSHGSTTPENNDIILWRMRRAYEFEPQARLRQHTSRALHLALSPDKTTIGKYLFGHAKHFWVFAVGAKHGKLYKKNLAPQWRLRSDCVSTQSDQTFRWGSLGYQEHNPDL